MPSTGGLSSCERSGVGAVTPSLAFWLVWSARAWPWLRTKGNVNTSDRTGQGVMARFQHSGSPRATDARVRQPPHGSTAARIQRWGPATDDVEGQLKRP